MINSNRAPKQTTERGWIAFLTIFLLGALSISIVIVHERLGKGAPVLIASWADP
jgi:hypothetical protein